jgi:hypothetical protein
MNTTRHFYSMHALLPCFEEGCQKCKTNEEAFDWLYEVYMQDIFAWEADDVEDEHALEISLISQIDRLIKENTLNKKCVRFLRYFEKKMTAWLAE